MELGIFHEFHRSPRGSESDAFDTAFAQAEAAEQYGFDTIWLAELHFSPSRSVLAAPLVIAAALAARTTRLKIGSAVHVLPLSNPLRTAEEAATVDHISHGRFEFGIGRSGFPTTYERFGVPYGESRDRLFEHLEIIRKAWTEETFSHKGEFFSYDNITLIPKPYQKPHPPIRIAVNSPDTYGVAGRMGCPSSSPYVWGSLMDWSSRCRSIAPPGKTRAPGAGRRRPATARLRGPNAGRGAGQSLRSTMGFYRFLGERLVESASRAGTRAIEARAEHGARLGTITYEEAQHDKLAYGTPAMVIDRLRELRASLGLSAILAEMNCGQQIPNQHILSSMRLFMEDVAPALR
jgi:alkanesulfonate monooxygenase SsuD/methylene tetrahydromethanopterin reductase-like flavin-dependent oxidoreductase (luciferase family)